MSTQKLPILTAIFIMAVLSMSSFLSGCCTPRMIDEVKAQLTDLDRQNQATRQKVNRIDSLLTEDMEANKRLRNDMSMTMADLQKQIDVLLENYNDLLQRIDKLAQQPAYVEVIKSSPGAQPATPPAGEPPQEAPAVDCDSLYDAAFILTRQTDYEKAIESFQRYFELCPKHTSVEDAYYWMGECYYSLEKYNQAIDQFDYLVAHFPSSPKASSALYKLGRSQQELGKIKKAKDIFKKLIDEYPETLEAEQAKDRLKELK